MRLNSGSSRGTGAIFTTLRVVLALGASLLFCVVPSEAPDETFHFIASDVSDTIAPWGGVKVVFSEPVADSGAINFIFEPSFYSYAVIWNGSRDTAVVQCTEPLQGNQRYVLRLMETVFSENGSEFDPSSDSIVFFTHPAEQEPNGEPSIADTLRGSCFGSIATADDTDMYVVTDTSAYALFLYSVGSQTTFALKNSSDSTTAKRNFKERDTLIIPKKFKPPVWVIVSSYYRSVGGYYEVGFTRRR